VTATPSIVALIPARAGSKRVPGKNVRRLGAHPVVAYTIASTIDSGIFADVIVSTDSEEIAAIARAYGADVPFLRPAELATDASPKVPVLQHVVREVERERGTPVDIVIDLDVTAPLRSDVDIRACWEMVQTPATDVVFTVTAAEKNPYFNMVELVDGYAVISKTPPHPVFRRQDAPPVYAMNASVYAFRRDHLMGDGRVIAPRARIVTMPSTRSRDIDQPLDFAFLEFLVREGHVELPSIVGALA